MRGAWCVRVCAWVVCVFHNNNSGVHYRLLTAVVGLGNPGGGLFPGILKTHKLQKSMNRVSSFVNRVSKVLDLVNLKTLSSLLDL